MTQCNCKAVGLTGGIATGKSTVSSILKEKGHIVIDADKISREVMDKNEPAYDDIVDIFGTKILLEDETIDRKRLGRLIFDSKNLRNALNQIVHPYILDEIKKQYDIYCKDNEVVFLDIPLLVEVYDDIETIGIKLDEIWLVYSDRKTQLERLMTRDKLFERDAINRIDSQLDIDLKKEYATRIIDNMGDMDLLKKNIDECLTKL